MIIDAKEKFKQKKICFLYEKMTESFNKYVEATYSNPLCENREQLPEWDEYINFKNEFLKQLRGEIIK